MTRNAWIVGTLGLLTLAGCAGLPQREKVAPPLARSALCEVGSQSVWGRAAQTPVATILMNNDGNWCWMNSTESQRGMSYGPFLTVLEQPKFGTLQINVTEADTRVAYRPNPGFTGSDTFRTRSQELNYDVNYQVTVNAR